MPPALQGGQACPSSMFIRLDWSWAVTTYYAFFLSIKILLRTPESVVMVFGRPAKINRSVEKFLFFGGGRPWDRKAWFQRCEMTKMLSENVVLCMYLLMWRKKKALKRLLQRHDNRGWKISHFFCKFNCRDLIFNVFFFPPHQQLHTKCNAFLTRLPYPDLSSHMVEFMSFYFTFVTFLPKNRDLRRGVLIMS